MRSKAAFARPRVAASPQLLLRLTRRLTGHDPPLYLYIQVWSTVTLLAPNTSSSAFLGWVWAVGLFRARVKRGARPWQTASARAVLTLVFALRLEYASAYLLFDAAIWLYLVTKFVCVVLAATNPGEGGGGCGGAGASKSFTTFRARVHQ